MWDVAISVLVDTGVRNWELDNIGKSLCFLFFLFIKSILVNIELIFRPTSQFAHVVLAL